jgi:hypothetical protein
MVNRLAYLRRIKKVLKEKNFKVFRRNIQKLDEEDGILFRETEFV